MFSPEDWWYRNEPARGRDAELTIDMGKTQRQLNEFANESDLLRKTADIFVGDIECAIA